MIIYGRSVAHAAKRAHVVIDMPFGSYQIGKRGAENAVHHKETGADSVKLEGGESFIETISYIIRASVPVMGHLGLTPQSVNCFGGYSVRAKEDAEAEKLLRDVKLLENGAAMRWCWKKYLPNWLREPLLRCVFL